MNITAIEFFSENGKITNNENDIKYRIENETLFVSFCKDKITKIVITTDVCFDENTLVLGEAFERAYGDLCWKLIEGRFIPWYFLAKNGNEIRGFGVKTLPNALCNWKITNGKLLFIADIGSGKNNLELNGRELEVCTFVTKNYIGDSFDAACDFCRAMCDVKILPKEPVYGGNDWYCNYGDSSYEKIIRHTKKIAECAQGLSNRPYMVIDDGWQLCHHNEEGDDYYFNGGPWTGANQRFKDMKKLAEEIKSFDVIPGIWVRPLLTVEGVLSKTVMKKDGIRYVLDPSVKETLDFVKEDIIRIKEWGYKLIKHDYTTFDIFGKWGYDYDENFTDNTQFHDRSRTTAQIIKDFYNAIREAAGDDVCLIGCNTISHLSAGIFEIQRTGDDTSGIDFERTKKMGVNALAFRMPQHNAFYATDADCVGITDKIAWENNKKWLNLLAKSGTPLFVSIEEGVLTDEIKNDISAAFKHASENTIIAYPVDWEEKEIPEKWVTAYGKVEYKF